MNEKEKAYCKHDLNVLFGSAVDTESHYPKTQVSSAFGMMCEDLVESTQQKDYGEEMLDIMLGTNYKFNATKSELEDYAELMKESREYYGTEFPAERYSPDDKIMYTESLIETLKDFGFEKIANLIGRECCIVLNGFDGSYLDFEDCYRYGSVLQIGKIASYDTDCYYFEGRSILAILQESWGYLTATNEEARKRNFKLADEEYKSLIEEEKKLARFMASLGVYAFIQI